MPDDVVAKAVSNGWVEGLLALIVLSGLGIMVWLVRSLGPVLKGAIESGAASIAKLSATTSALTIATAELRTAGIANSEQLAVVAQEVRDVEGRVLGLVVVVDKANALSELRHVEHNRALQVLTDLLELKTRPKPP